MNPRTIRHTHLLMLIALCAMSIVQCVKDAPRDNPLDPAINPDQGWIRGTVFTYYPPLQPIENAHIYILPVNRTIQVAQDGSFSIVGLSKGEYQLIASADQYASDTSVVQLSHASGLNMDFRLDALPQIKSYRVSSGHINRWLSPYNRYVFQLDVEVSDADGFDDIQLVEFSIPKISFIDTLIRSDIQGYYTIQYYDQEMPSRKIQSLMGHPMYLQLNDRPGAISRSESVYLARVIEDIPYASEPQGLVTVSNRPDLYWEAADVPFDFTWKIDLTRFNEETQLKTLVWNVENIPSDSTHIQVSSWLNSGEYYWTVSIVDEFGNWSRSKVASFQVAN